MAVGWGTEALLGIQPDGAIGTFVPVTIFVFLFGLTMDYEVFILSRIREEYDRTGSTTEPRSAASAAPDGWSPARR